MINQFGAVAEPAEVLWHNPKVAQAALEFGAKVAAWDVADESLKTFAHTAVAAQVGCSWCLELRGEDVLELVAIDLHRGAPIESVQGDARGRRRVVPWTRSPATSRHQCSACWRASARSAKRPPFHQRSRAYRMPFFTCDFGYQLHSPEKTR
jgi:hypothetical protein